MNSIANQVMRVTTGKLNTVNDPAPGQVLASPSGSLVPSYPGQVGQKFYLTAEQAKRLSDTSIGTLYGGVYQYVQFKTTSVAAMVRGHMLYWADRENFIVTADVAAATHGNFAGIAICVITKGNYGFIQIAGKATVKFAAATTKVAPAAGDLVLMDATPTAAMDVILDATALTSPLAKLIVGKAIEAPVAGALKLVELTFGQGSAF